MAARNGAARNGRSEAARRARLAEGLKAVADPVRLEILAFLRKPGRCSCGDVDSTQPACCVCDVEAVLGLAQSTTSHHLAVLQRAGLVTAEKRGPWVLYRRNDEAIRSLSEEVARTL